jgi:hypothetical protein
LSTTSNSGTSALVRFVTALVVGVGITVVTGAVCGRVSQRWGPVPDMVAAGEHLKSLPAQIGSWQLVEDDTMPEAVIRTLSCAGYVNRKYVDRHSGSTVMLAIYVGPTGPISVHTPEICYSSRDYLPEENRQRVQLSDLGGKAQTFWCTTFRSNNVLAEQLRVYYGWCAEHDWMAAESPRFDFAGWPLLFKLQISSLVPPGEKGAAQDPCRAFLEDLLKSGWKVNG